MLHFPWRIVRVVLRLPYEVVLAASTVPVRPRGLDVVQQQLNVLYSGARVACKQPSGGHKVLYVDLHTCCRCQRTGTRFPACGA
jgi:hypothetical protein